MHLQFVSAYSTLENSAPYSAPSPHTDPKSFIALSMVLETVGGSAYIGAAKLIEDGDTLTAAAVCAQSLLIVSRSHPAPPSPS